VTLRYVACAIFIAAASGAAHASPRGPVYVEAGASAGFHPWLSDGWSLVSVDLKLGGGLWFGQRLAVYGQLGLAPRLSRVDATIPAAGETTEWLRFATADAGIKVNLWPRAYWIQVDLVAAVTGLVGRHDLVLHDATVHRRALSSLGGTAGIELSIVKFKKQGVSMAALYHRRPTDLGDDNGYRETGRVDLGGFEIVFGFAIYLGGH
jgi:hypothetical protein